MKKFIALLFLLSIVTLPCFAVLTTEETTSQNYLENHAYSKEMARIVDLQKAQINGTKTKYVSNEPDWYTNNKLVKFVRKTFMYFDCGLDDGKFMQDNINYTNRWDDL